MLTTHRRSTFLGAVYAVCQLVGIAKHGLSLLDDRLALLWRDNKVKQFCDLKVLILRSSLEAAKNKVKQFLTFSWALMQAKTSFRDNKVKQFLKPLPVLGLRYLRKET